MAEIVFVVRAARWQYMTSRLHISVTEDELQAALDMLDPSLNPLNVNAVELRDYIDGRGELALRVELAGQHRVIKNLLTHVAYFVAQGDSSTTVIESHAHDEGRIESVDYQSVFVRSGSG